jgi:hypothetical protein
MKPLAALALLGTIEFVVDYTLFQVQLAPDLGDAA